MADSKPSEQDVTALDDKRNANLTLSVEKLDTKLDSSSLDPKDWSAFRSIAYGMVDQSIEFIQQIREKSIYNIIPIPEHVCDQLDEPVPEKPQGLERVCQDFNTLVLPYPFGNVHPRFWGWAVGAGNAGGIIAQSMVATMNSNAAGGTQSSTLVERQVLRWCRQIFGFPDTSGGLMVSGTTMATIIALAIARNHALGNEYDVRLEGITGGPRLVGYASTETHLCSWRAFELLGIGRKSLRLIPVDANFCIDMNQLEKTINEDLQAGFTPFCVIGNVGTVNTGSIDDLRALKSFASKYKLWFHIDGAVGALAILSKELKPRLLGIEQADSLAFDFHKWLHVPYEAGCVLLRDKKQQLATFSSHGRYLTDDESHYQNGYELYFQFGPELSRGFRALSTWFTLKEHGTQRLGEKIYENCEQVKYFASLLSQYSWIHVHQPITLNIICFRVQPDGLTDEKEIDTFNRDVSIDIQQSGVAIPSTTVLNSRLYIRCCVMNHRTVYADFDLFVETLVKLTQERLSK